MGAPTFSFRIGNNTNFSVVDFTGSERMSGLYRYDIGLKIRITDDTTPVAELLPLGTRFSFMHDNETINLNGVLESLRFERSDESTYHYYRAVLRPSWWRESLGVDFEIFKNQSPRTIITGEVPSTVNVNYAANQNFDARPFTCQFNESNVNFVSRLAEYYGIYYYFDFSQSPDSDMLIFADDNMYDPCPSLDENLSFSSTATGDAFFSSVSALSMQMTQSASGVDVMDSNMDQMSQEVSGSAGESNKGSTMRLINENVISSADAARIATIRMQEITARSEVYEGRSGSPYLRPGFTFGLTGHTMSSLNQTYLLTEVVHRGSNLDATADSSTQATYSNTFKAIVATRQYRPPCRTSIPQAFPIRGWVHSSMDDTMVAERDTQGRYKVRFGFFNKANDSADRSVEPSHFIRAQQPVGGASNTMDVPFPGGTTVTIAFTNNNPDLPFIQGAVFDADLRSMAASQNTDNAVVQTDSLLALISERGRLDYSLASTGTVPTDNTNTVRCFPKNGTDNQDFYDNDNDDFGARVILPFVDVEGGVNNLSVTNLTDLDEASGRFNIERKYGDIYQLFNGDKVHWHNGNIYDFGGYWNYNLGNSYTENFIDQAAPLNTRLENIPFTATPAKSESDLANPDLLDNTGPGWRNIRFPVPPSGNIKSMAPTENDIDPTYQSQQANSTAPNRRNTVLRNSQGQPIGFSLNPNRAKPWDYRGVNVEKTFNESYSYTHGNAISVDDRVNKLDIRYHDANTTETEMYYLGGNLREWTRYNNTVTETRKWRPNGKLNSHSITNGREGTSWEELYTLEGSRKISTSFSDRSDRGVETRDVKYDATTGAPLFAEAKATNGGATISTSFSYGLNTSLTASFNQNLSVSLSGSTSVAVKLDVGAALDVNISASAKMDVDIKLANIKFEQELVKTKLNAAGSLTMEAGALKFKKNRDLSAEIDSLKMNLRSLDLATHQLAIKTSNLSTEMSSLSVGMGTSINL